MRRLALVLFAACGSPAAMPDAAISVDASPDAGGTDKTAGCASTFGAELTNAFGRVDGTVLAIVPPGNQTCAMPNSTHVVLEVTMNGAAYRMVVNVLSTSNVPDVWLGTADAALAGPPWSEGWHPDVQLDYLITLGVTKAMFTESMQAAAVARVTDAITIGAHISVFATSSGGTQAASTHLIHRNLPNQDGAIVLNPETTPHYLLTAFPEQMF